jgi:murein DD-endopeptidase MepM/ murein hydrolase activator NlpD
VVKIKKNKWKNFFRKIRFQYRVSVLNENTLEESWHIRLSRFKVFLYLTFFIGVTFFLLASLIIYTPLKYYLPGYGSPNDRMEIIGKSIQIDSLLQQMQLQSTYLDVLKGIITGDIESDSTYIADTITLKERAEVLMEKSKVEKEFVARYEAEEKFNLASLALREVENVFVFFKPTKGVISSSFNMEDRQYGISMVTAANESVLSVLAGTVIYTSFSMSFGWVIQVQHQDHYLSIYKHNTMLLKKPGDNVKAGEVIAFTGDDPNNKTGNHFYFELWRQGKPIDPEEVIIF